MKILITGCSSYIGQYLIERFLDNKNYQIIGISRSKPKFLTIDLNGLNMI